METFIIFDKTRVVVQVDGNGYYETYENFVSDYGQEIDFDNIDYNKTYGFCSLNGEPGQEYPNALCEDILNSFDRLVANKFNRDNPPPTLDDAKLIKIDTLKDARDINEQQPVTTDKGTFDVDSKSLERINGAITVLGITQGTIEWTLADNTVVTVNAGDLTNVIIALAQQSNSVHEKYRQLKEQVLACETVEQVEAIVW